MKPMIRESLSTGGDKDAPIMSLRLKDNFFVKSQSLPGLFSFYHS
ncbi:Uncharacterised protein [Serratia plymuthica]|nr:Uncharacterised protein [Serratia plymuthica]VEI19702.1 Uncharacterised protein [Serratia plymuthica]